MRAWFQKVKWRMAGLIPAISQSDGLIWLKRARIKTSFCQVVVADPDGEFGKDPWPKVDGAKGVTLGERLLVSFGDCREVYLTVWKGPFQSHARFERVIAAPLRIENGAIVICAPDELPGNLSVPIENGDYRIVAAMEDFDEITQAMDLFIEKVQEPLQKAELLVADSMITSGWQT